MTGEELKKEIASVGLTMTQVAKEMGISQQALYQRFMHKKVSNDTITKVLSIVKPYKQQLHEDDAISKLRREVNELRKKVEELTDIIYNREKDNG